jgi:molybdopterin converting factor small subunit
MAEIKILYFGILREIVGAKQEMLQIDDSTPATEIVSKLAEKHGKRFHDFVLDSKGMTRAGLAYAVNGDTMEEIALEKTKCKDVKEFVILPPISGGS